MGSSNGNSRNAGFGASRDCSPATAGSSAGNHRRHRKRRFHVRREALGLGHNSFEAPEQTKFSAPTVSESQTEAGAERGLSPREVQRLCALRGLRLVALIAFWTAFFYVMYKPFLALCHAAARYWHLE
jgi:hypothetical protein